MRVVRGLSVPIKELRNRLLRARYFRGHGVHSPYIYMIVREVFMRRSLMSGPRELYEALLAEEVREHRAVQLQNLMIHCSYQTFGLNCADVDLCVLTREISRVETLKLIAEAAEKRCTVALISPHEGSERQALCEQIVAQHPSTTVDNRAYLLVFNNHLPKQHFRI